MNQPVTQSDLPPAWVGALSSPQATSGPLEGAYRDKGEWLWPGARQPGVQSLARWALLLTDAEFRALGPGPFDEVEIRQPDARHLHVRVRQGGAWIREQTLDIEPSPETNGAVVVTRSQAGANANVAAVANQRLSARLFKGADGRLYGHFSTGALGVAFLLPMSTHVEFWGRWEPVRRAP